MRLEGEDSGSSTLVVEFSSFHLLIERSRALVSPQPPSVPRMGCSIQFFEGGALLTIVQCSLNATMLSQYGLSDEEADGVAAVLKKPLGGWVASRTTASILAKFGLTVDQHSVPTDTVLSRLFAGVSVVPLKVEDRSEPQVAGLATFSEAAFLLVLSYPPGKISEVDRALSHAMKVVVRRDVPGSLP